MSESKPTTQPLMQRIGDIWLTYFKGQMVMAVIVGALMWVINAGMGMHRPLLVGAVAGLLQTVPTFGPLVSAVLAAIMALVKGSTVIGVDAWVFALIVLGVYLVVQQVVALVLEPRIMGKRLSLHPLIVFLAVLLGATVGNVIGAVLAVPLVATAREVWLEISLPQSRS